MTQFLNPDVGSKLLSLTYPLREWTLKAKGDVIRCPQQVNHFVYSLFIYQRFFSHFRNKAMGYSS